MIPDRSPETESLFRILGALQPGQELSFAEMQARAGFDVQEYLERLYYVRDTLRKDGVAVIDRTKAGVRRLTDSEVIEVHSRRQRRRAGKAAFRGSAGLTSVDYEKLSEAEKTAHNAHQSAFGALRVFTKEATFKRLEARVKQCVLLPREVLKLFGG